MAYFKYKNHLISTEQIRYIRINQSPPQGGPPYHSSAVIRYFDGHEMTVSLEFAEALIEALKQKTINHKAAL